MLLRLAVIVCALFACLPAVARAQEGERIIVRHEPGSSAAERADARGDADVALERRLPLSGVELVTADGDGDRALAALRADPGVRWAEPDRRRRAEAEPLSGLLWGLHNTGQSIYGARGAHDADIDAPEAWAVTRGAGVGIAVVDSGVDAGHPDLAPRLLAGYDWVDADADPADLDGHGTHVAGTIAAAENGAGIVGVAPQSELIPLRVLDASGSGWGADVAAAFAWAGDRGVRVVNASLGSSGATLAEQMAIREHPDTLYVVSAGNGESDVDATPHYPCSYPEPNVLCVGASDFRDRLATFSNHGALGVDLFAPGVRIVSTFPRGLDSNLAARHDVAGGYESLDGTSMAAPHAAGAAALVAAAHPGYTAAQIKRALIDTADRVPALDGKAVAGGRVNAAAALGSPAPAPSDIDAPSVPAGLTATAQPGAVALDWDDVADAELAGYRVYQRSALDYWKALPVAQPGASAAVVGGLPGDVAQRFAVAAVDHAGNESAKSGLVEATPTAQRASAAPAPSPEPPAAPSPAPEPPAAPAPSPAPAPAAPAAPPVVAPAQAAAVPRARLRHVRVLGKVVLCRSGRCRPRSAAVRFMASADTPVAVRLRRRACAPAGCAWAAAGTTEVTARAGWGRLRIARTVAGLPVRAGRYRLTLATALGSSSVSFAVRAR